MHVTLEPQPAGRAAQAYVGFAVQQAPEKVVPSGHPPSPGIMQAPPENWVRTQTSLTAQLDDPQEKPAASAVEDALLQPLTSASAKTLAKQK